MFWGLDEGWEKCLVSRRVLIKHRSYPIDRANANFKLRGPPRKISGRALYSPSHSHAMIERKDVWRFPHARWWVARQSPLHPPYGKHECKDTPLTCSWYSPGGLKSNSRISAGDPLPLRLCAVASLRSFLPAARISAGDPLRQGSAR
jgi:hypothetical protein